MSASTPAPSAYRIADLPQTRPTAFTLAPTAETMAAIAAELDLSALRKLRFSGQIVAQGRSDWRVEGQLGATVVQPCVVTLDPVTTRIDVPVSRTYLADYAEPEGAEVEMPEDDSVEPLPDLIDLDAIMNETLALHIPAYPRKDTAETGNQVFTEPGKEALTDEDVRPFAGLAALRDKLADKE